MNKRNLCAFSFHWHTMRDSPCKQLTIALNMTFIVWNGKIDYSST